MNTQQIIQRILGGYLDRTKAYPSPLLPALQLWYCYTIDGGHSIVIAPKQMYVSGGEPESFLVPAPVKTVLRGYEQRDGYILVDLPYSSEIGLIVPEGDEEF